MDLSGLINKYSHAGPRYTSYPTAPQWSESLSAAAYRDHLALQRTKTSRPIAFYFHIPYCETLCYYCGCNIQITKQKEKGPEYVDSLIRELELLAEHLGSERVVSQISWGGGTPTFLPAAQMQRLHENTRRLFTLADDAEVSIEVDPRVTSDEQLTLLASLGFNRISLGVQDFDAKVQQAVNRVQPAAMTEGMLNRCRELGFRGINFDLIYGLPFQTLSTFEKTIEEVIRMRPDRIALYNYARLPTMIKHQVILEKHAMPDAQERVAVFISAYEKLQQAGYVAIGMDHFALESDELFRSLNEGSLHRNFMGYTVKRGTDLIGVGASAIGEFESAYFQNQREAKSYQAEVAKPEFATFRGFLLSEDDCQRKWIIQAVMCQFKLSYREFEERFGVPFLSRFAEEREKLLPFVSDKILLEEADGFSVTPLGRLFVRNIAMVFDAYLKKPQPVTYSKTV